MNRGDRWIIGLALILTFFGVLMVYSAGSFASFIHHQGGGYYLQQQAVRVVLGGALMWFCARKLNLRWLETISPWTLGACCLLLVAVIAVGHTSKGATRTRTAFSRALGGGGLIGSVVGSVVLHAAMRRRPAQRMERACSSKRRRARLARDSAASPFLRSRPYDHATRGGGRSRRALDEWRRGFIARGHVRRRRCRR